MAGQQLLAVHHELERLCLGAKVEVAGEGGEVRIDGGFEEGETKIGGQISTWRSSLPLLISN